MGLRDRLAADAARLAKAGADRAIERIAASEGVGRLAALVDMDDGVALTPEGLLVALVQAVHGDAKEDLDDRGVRKEGKRRHRRAGAVGALAGPIGLRLAGLYCEADLLCDVADRHGLALGDDELAAHLLVLWNAMPDLPAASAAIAGTGPTMVDRVRAMTKKDAVLALWRLRDADPPSGRDVLLPGKRVKAFIAEAEQRLGVA